MWTEWGRQQYRQELILDQARVIINVSTKMVTVLDALRVRVHGSKSRSSCLREKSTPLD